MRAILFIAVLTTACEFSIETSEPTYTPEQLNELGVQKLQAGDYAGAVEMFEIVVQHVPDEPMPWSNLCNAAGAAEMHDKALAVCATAAKLNPKDGNIHHVVGHIHMDAKDFEAAKKSFHRAIELDPSDAASHNGLAGALHELGDGAGAVAAAQKAVEVDVDPSRMLFAGQLMALHGQCDGARKLLAQAREKELDVSGLETTIGKQCADTGKAKRKAKRKNKRKRRRKR